MFYLFNYDFSSISIFSITVGILGFMFYKIIWVYINNIKVDSATGTIIIDLKKKYKSYVKFR